MNQRRAATLVLDGPAKPYLLPGDAERPVQPRCGAKRSSLGSSLFFGGSVSPFLGCNRHLICGRSNRSTSTRLCQTLQAFLPLMGVAGRYGLQTLEPVDTPCLECA